MLLNSKLKGIALAGALIMGSTLSSYASSPKDKDKSKGTNTTMKVEVVDQNGKVVLSDMVQDNDPSLNYNMESLPSGSYRIKVSQGSEVINITEVRRDLAKNGISYAVYNSSGSRIMSKDSGSDNFNFDLSELPKGEYEVVVYHHDQVTNRLRILN